jgi:hypothetical protein
MYVHVLHNSLHPTVDRCDVAWMMIDRLPDVALLRIFGFCMDEGIDPWSYPWYSLALQVCQNWRKSGLLVTASPESATLLFLRHANERDVGHLATLIKDRLLPRKVRAAHEHNNRICEFKFDDTSRPQLGKAIPCTDNFVLTMKQPLVDPDSFLGGSAPCLQTLN